MASFSFRLHRKSAGRNPLVLLISHKGRNARLYLLRTRLLESEWDDHAQRVINHPARDAMNAYLQNIRVRLTNALYSFLATNDKEITIARLKTLAKGVISPEEPQGDFLAWYDDFTARHRATRTRALYAATREKIVLFDAHARALVFSDITRQWLERFDLWLSETSPSANARAIHLRNIRAAFNDARDNGRTQFYPFRAFKIRTQATPKRALSLDELRALVAMPLTAERAKFRDAFLLSFYLIGINPADLFTLTPAAVQNGRVVYNRAKTGRLYSVKIEPEAAALLERYKCDGLLVRFAEGAHSYRVFSSLCNHRLKDMHRGLTLYWARHTWATLAAKCGVPEVIISAALGHGGNPLTGVYIKRDQKDIDRANRQVLDYVANGFKS